MKAEQLIVGELYSDMPDSNDDQATIFRLVSTSESRDEILFEYVSGEDGYIREDELILFPYDAEFYQIKNK